MKNTSILFIFFFLLVQYSSAQIGRFPLSPKQTTEQHIGKTDITLSYCRPSMRERTIYGDLVPYNKLWRTGANKNTKITFSEDVELGGTLVKKGKYTLFTIPGEQEWELQLYPFTDEYGIPENYDNSKVVARMTATSNKIPSTQQVLSINIGDFTNFKFDLVISWENTTVAFPFKLTNRKIMEELISHQLDGPRYNDYYSAATYQLEAGAEYEKGLQYIDKAIEMASPLTWWDYRMKARILAKMNRNEEAKLIAEKALKMAEEVQSEYGISTLNNILNEL